MSQEVFPRRSLVNLFVFLHSFVYALKTYILAGTIFAV
jgi:hypothetical protein